MAQEIFIKDTHRGLLYEDGVFKKVLEAGRYEIREPGLVQTRIPGGWPWQVKTERRPQVEIVLVDVREKELTIKGQEILTADKVAIRVSIVVQFQVTDPRAAVHQVENYEDRLYSDVQLAARRSLACMALDEILTNRNRLSEDIRRDVKEAASGYGVAILRADVKDLAFPGNLQEIMNRVLAAERNSQAQLVEARAKAETARIEAQSQAEARRLEAEAQAEAQRLAARAEAEAQRIKTESDIRTLREQEQAAQAYAQHPALLRLAELDTLRDLARTANAKLYINFHTLAKPEAGDQD